MDTHLLHAFVAVAECEGFSAAARVLDRTQSAVSQQIRLLEERVGAPLFKRSSRHVVLTAAGGQLLPYARRILQLQAEAGAAIANDRRAELIRLGLSEESASAYLPRLLPELTGTYPNVRLEIVCDISSRLVELFHEGLLDLVLAVRHDPTPTGRLLGRERMVWAVAEDRSVADWDILPLALNPEGCIFRKHAFAALGKADRKWDVRYTSRSPTAINAAVQSGLAVTVKTPRSLPAGCRVAGVNDRLPELGCVEIEMHRAPGRASNAFESFTSLLESLSMHYQIPEHAG